jgi:DNA-binding transcriptional MerR regulator
MGTFTIGRLAEAAGVHVETVRYYERRGLIEPPPRSPSGYRQYSAADLWRLQFIARGKQLGFTLTEIADVLGDTHRTPGAVLTAAQAKIAAVDERIAELARIRCRLEQLADLCRDGDSADCVALRVTG